jgi:PPOX class probable F420-dependent enzyme
MAQPQSSEMEKVEQAWRARGQSDGAQTALTPGLQRLLHEPAYCQIATVMPDGSPQITQVWVDTDGQHVLVNTAEARQKTRNIRRDPRVAVNVVDPHNGWRLATIRGRVVEMTTEGSDEFIDRLAQKYLGVDSYPFRRPDEVRVTLVIAPEHIHEIGLEP